jgi:hypothetical protein
MSSKILESLLNEENSRNEAKVEEMAVEEGSSTQSAWSD